MDLVGYEDVKQDFLCYSEERISFGFKTRGKSAVFLWIFVGSGLVIFTLATL